MKSLCNGWDYTSCWDEAFLHGEGSFKTVRLPHTVGEAPLHYASPSDYEKICGYRRILRVPSDARDKRVFLQLDGAAHIARVYVNGTFVGEHRSGYTAYRVELTDFLNKEEDNLLAIRLDCTENPSIPPFGYMIDYLTYGGLYREAWLDYRDPVMIGDVFVSTPDLHTAVIRVEAEGSPDSVKVEIKDENGTVLASAQEQSSNFELKCPQAEPWEPSAPKLYFCEVSAIKNGEVTDFVCERFGFRTAEFKANEFLLNGKPYFLRGLNRHQAYPYIGYAATASLQREDARILKQELSCNVVRTSHYPQSRHFIDACDELGLPVFTEIPGWQHLGDAAWKEQCLENVREMILQYRNHPSIILWGVRVNESVDDDALYEKTNALAHELDPTRATGGVRYIKKSHLYEDVYTFNDFVHKGDNAGVTEKKAVTTDMNKPLLVTEHNGHMFPTKTYDTWAKREEHALRHAKVQNAAAADGNHVGCIGWCMFDYATHKDFGSGDKICYHGVLDSFRNPKLAAAVYAAQGEETPALEIGCPMDIGDYPGGHLNSFYAFTNGDEIAMYKNDVYVRSFYPEKSGLKHPPILINDTIGSLLETQEGFSPAKAADLHKCLASAQKYGYDNMPLTDKARLAAAMLKYHMTFSDGLKLYGKYVANWGGESIRWRFDAKKNGEVIASVTKCPGNKLHIKAIADHTALKESSTYDMAAIRLQLLDENNNPAVFAQLPLTVSVIGPLEVCGPSVITAEGGMTGVYLKTIGCAGEASVTVRGYGMEPVTIPFHIETGDACHEV